MDLGRFGRLLHLRVGRIQLAQAEVLADAAIEEHIVLEHRTHLPSDRLECHLAQVHAIKKHVALLLSPRP